MMIISHVMTVITNPGEMIRDYEHLQEEDLPKDFYNLISLRESIYAELVVRKKMRKGELTKESIPNFHEVVERSRSLRQSQKLRQSIREEVATNAIEEESKLIEVDGYNRAEVDVRVSLDIQNKFDSPL